MKSICLILMLLFALSGCRFTISADKLALHVAVDQAAYLSDEDPTTYTDAPAINPDTVN
ncbi:hypothetical protein KAR91_84845 [Candidatus Pacearchaeota archaeon]|nr:hypothetical protein [Candidatus Pacearchaeota archaeon]